MKTYDAGESFNLTIDITPVGVPTSATYRVLDQAGVIVVDATVLTVYGDDESLSIPITSAITTLTEGVRRRLLDVHLEVSGDNGELFKFRESALIQNLTNLLIPAESFQSVNEATLIAMDIHQLDNWTASDHETRRQAMIEAAHRISLVRFIYFNDLETEFFNHVTSIDNIDLRESWGNRRIELSAMTLEEFNELPERFISDLKVAQVIEADTVLGLETSEDKRASGVLSDTVGETSQMFRTGKPMSAVICKRAMRRLSRWIDSTWRAGRG